jgi:hypothetical protein
MCGSPDKAAHYHTLGPKLGASCLKQHLAGLGVKVVSVIYLLPIEPFHDFLQFLMINVRMLPKHNVVMRLFKPERVERMVK